jgi:hypothetical protein
MAMVEVLKGSLAQRSGNGDAKKNISAVGNLGASTANILLILTPLAVQYESDSNNIVKYLLLRTWIIGSIRHGGVWGPSGYIGLGSLGHQDEEIITVLS